MIGRHAGTRSLWVRPLRFGAATSDRVRQQAANAATEWQNSTARTLFFLLQPTTLTSGRAIWNRDSTNLTHLVEVSGTAGAIHVRFDRATTDDDIVTAAGVLRVNRWQWVFIVRDSAVTPVLKVYSGTLTDPAQLVGVASQVNGAGALDVDAGLLTTVGNTWVAAPTGAFQGLIGMYGMVNRVLSVAEMRDIQTGRLQGPPLIIPGLLELLNLGENGAGQIIASYGTVDPLNYVNTGAKGVGSGNQPLVPILARGRRRPRYKPGISGPVDITGIGAATSASTSTAGTAEEQFSGAGTAASLNTATASAAQEKFQGTGTAASANTSTAGTAEEKFTGTGAATSANTSTAGTAEEKFTGTGAAASANTSTAGIAEERFTGAGTAASLNAATAGTAEERFSGTGNAASLSSASGLGEEIFQGPGTAASANSGTTGTGIVLEAITGTGDAASANTSAGGTGFQGSGAIGDAASANTATAGVGELRFEGIGTAATIPSAEGLAELRFEGTGDATTAPANVAGEGIAPQAVTGTGDAASLGANTAGEGSTPEDITGIGTAEGPGANTAGLGNTPIIQPIVVVGQPPDVSLSAFTRRGRGKYGGGLVPWGPPITGKGKAFGGRAQVRGAGQVTNNIIGRGMAIGTLAEVAGAGTVTPPALPPLPVPPLPRPIIIPAVTGIGMAEAPGAFVRAQGLVYTSRETLEFELMDDDDSDILRLVSMLILEGII